ncbi:TRAP transporter small permease [Salipiger bermudensis]|uniref:TRAP transporter small permease n=1 Tax=Salipiger bermudensis TaxID=344736 RepID=UPI001A8C812A|nr:TRAP transporter small permease [Salipiger bermudensis]MBN9677537.1 TRAP transporter small permease [Salipiger bermudensis]
MLTTTSRKLNGFSRGLNSVVLGCGCVFLVAMVVLICLQVVARYGFASPPAWTEELARYAMVWVGLLGASASYYERFDPALVKIPARAPRWLKLATATVRAAAVLLFLVPILWYCFFGPGMNLTRGFLNRNMTMMAETVPLPMIWVAIAVPTFIVLTFLHGLARTFATVTGTLEAAGDPDTAEADLTTDEKAPQ